MKSSRLVALSFSAAFVVYVLSPGAVGKYYHSKHERPPASMLAFYGPLMWLANRAPVIDQAYRLYFRMWGATRFDGLFHEAHRSNASARN